MDFVSQIFGVISPATALLVMLGTFALLIAGLVASGIVSVKIVVEEKDEKKPKEDLEKTAKEADVVEDKGADEKPVADETAAEAVAENAADSAMGSESSAVDDEDGE